MRGERLRGNAAYQQSMLRKPKAKCDLCIYKCHNKADRFFFSPLWKLRVIFLACGNNSEEKGESLLPWISSLKVQYLLRYLCRRRNALALAKSSNWMRQFMPYLEKQESMHYVRKVSKLYIKKLVTFEVRFWIQALCESYNSQHVSVIFDIFTFIWII